MGPVLLDQAGDDLLAVSSHACMSSFRPMVASRGQVTACQSSRWWARMGAIAAARAGSPYKASLALRLEPLEYGGLELSKATLSLCCSALLRPLTAAP